RLPGLHAIYGMATVGARPKASASPGGVDRLIPAVGCGPYSGGGLRPERRVFADHAAGTWVRRPRSGDKMLCLTRPTGARTRSYRARRGARPCSSPPVGPPLGEPPPGYAVDPPRLRLGAGPLVFERARAALRDWAMFRLGWAEVWPERPPIEPGAV